MAVLQTDTRHRHQILHGYLCRDLTRAYLLLYAFRKKLNQRQTARHPTHTAIELAGQLLQAITETLLELGEQPTFFQGALSFRPMQGAVEHQCRDFTDRPDHGLDRVPAELLQGRDALVTVNDQIAIRLIGYRNDDDRSLLPRSGQRCQQLPLPLRISYPQMFVPAIELMKLQLHRGATDIKPADHLANRDVPVKMRCVPSVRG